MAEDWIDALALRFASTKTLGELLARAAAGHPPYAERVRAAQQRITELAEQAMGQRMIGGGLAPRLAQAEDQQRLVAAVGEGVDGLGQQR